MSGTARRATAEKEWSSTELERARSDLSAKTAAERAARAEAADESARADKVQRMLEDADAKAQRAMALADEVRERIGTRELGLRASLSDSWRAPQVTDRERRARDNAIERDNEAQREVRRLQEGRGGGLSMGERVVAHVADVAHVANVVRARTGHPNTTRTCKNRSARNVSRGSVQADAGEDGRARA